MRRMFKEMAILGLTAVAGLYLINPTAGVFEFIPDVIPVVGNLDEAGATLIILATLRYYGLDIGKLFNRDDKAKNDAPASWTPYPPQQQTTSSADIRIEREAVPPQQQRRG